MQNAKPRRLRLGDTVAVLSPSWGGPSVFPIVYENGIKVIRDWGLQVKEFPGTRGPADFIRNHPEARAHDINAAFLDDEVSAIIASIGGDDSIRILPFLDPKVILEHPKILMGYSDTTTLLTYLNQLGLVTFHGPSIMAGFSQMQSLPDAFESHVRRMLFDPQETHEYEPFETYCDGYPHWSDPSNVGKVNTLKPNQGWNFLQGAGRVQGELWGGCIEVLEFMKGTRFWPEPGFWRNKLIFFETSEDKPSATQVKWMLRNYGMQGVFGDVHGVLFGRAYGYSDLEKESLNAVVQEVVADEFHRPDMALLTNLDFGHTDPQVVLPLGVTAEIDLDSRRFRLLEPAVY
jgi:muramoyltetrapeptide carboxypeptidase LdcA involved in peptidoglycan recycling